MTVVSQEADMKMKLQNESVVISGISGVYPQARSVNDLSNILYNRVNPITEATHWQFKHPEATKFSGRAPNLDYFDAQFFRVHSRLSNSMDPMSRKVLEQTYQAIYDAGVSPEHLKGKNVGVYIGTSFSESESTGFYNNIMKTSLGIIGSSKAMFANRISYWLHVKGPSVAIEGSCCSSAVALEQAYLAIKSGICEAAIVGTCHICYLPHSTVHYGRATKMSPDGKTRSFDQYADGFTKSDAANVLFLQKAGDALRVYAQVIHVKTEFTLKSTELSCAQPFGFYREPEHSAEFLNNFYNDVHISPNDVEYVEAFGSAIPDADKAELDAFDQVFCRNRSTPLLVGSVMSNVGYTEAATGLIAITKVLLAYETGLLASNLHCKNPRQDISALREGRMHIVNDHCPFNRTYAAVNGLSFNGINSHVLLHGYYKTKDPARYVSSMPRLVTISSRTESGVKNIFERLKSRPIDPEELALLHNIHATNISGHLGRGYIVLDTKGQETVSCLEQAEHFDGVKRPLWFVYSGMGSQWPGMGAQLMRIPRFAAAIERCRRVLEPEGVDVIEIITSTDKTIFDNILNSFVGIAAVQIGLTDILHELGLTPDNIIGHSVGELGCAYADGCLTAEEMILSAYSRGLVSLQTPLIRGSMAAVGLGYEEISKLCPSEIEVACHNGPDSCTISGPADTMRAFVSNLTNKGIFAKEVPCSNIAYHSRYISGAGPGLQEYLSKIIRHPKARSDRWVSTSVPRDKWNEPAAKYSSAEYHTNNLLNPVLFEETSRLIPPNAVLVEVAPHGLLQAILKRSLFSGCQNIPLTKRGHPNNVLFLLNAIGRLYMEGYSPKVQVLYPKVEFPVSTGTPMLSHLVEWMHTDAWNMPFCAVVDKKHAASCEFLISIHDAEYNYLQGNRIGGKILFPYAGVLVAVWDTLAMCLCEKKKFSVRFHDLHLYSQPVLHDQRLLRLKVSLQRATGRFEVSNEHSKVASGFISSLLLIEDTKSFIKHYNESEEPVELEKSDIYELFSERDYSYSGNFCSIHTANVSLTEALLEWNNNWVTLIDGMLQLNALKQSHDGVSYPVFIRKLVINTNEHYNNKIINNDGKNLMKVDIVKTHDFTRCGGIFMQNIRFYNLPKDKLKKFKSFLLSPSLHTRNQDNHEISTDNKEYSMEEHATLGIKSVGNINSLHWVKNTHKNELNNTDICVTVHYAGLNISDLKRATGIVTCNPMDNHFGMEFSGINAKGDRVMGLLSGGACSTRVVAHSDLIWPVPAYWTLEDAATVPFAYTLAFYCLAIKVELQPHISILVHGGTGALGQAVISIALAHKCQVFTTVSSNIKKSLLCKLYPDLNERNIGNSRDPSFGDMVLNATNGKGCDIVISNVGKGLKNISLKCTGYNGFTFDLSQIFNSDNYYYGMGNMTQQRSYLPLDFSSIFDPANSEDRQILQSLMSEGISRGYVRPLTRTTFPADKVSSAFRLLANNYRHGRVLLRLKETSINPQPRVLCSSNHCQVLVGDGSKLVMQVAERLIHRGARRIYYHVPTVLTSFDRFKIESWKNFGVDVKVSSDTLTSTDSVKSFITNAENFGVVESIFVFMVDLDREKKLKKLSSLVKKIDSVSRNLCPVLKYFAIITNNHWDVVDSVCDSRKNDGFPATLLNLSNFQKDTLNVSELGELNVLDTLECSVNNMRNSPVMIARQEFDNKPSLLQQIETITNIKLSEIDDSITLRELGVNDTQCQVMNAFLRDTYNVFLTANKISTLTRNRIDEVEQFITEPYFNDVKGLDNFFSYVDKNELLANAEIIPISTWAHEVISKDDDFDVSQTYLCIVPGMEGLHGRFHNLCERLKIPALVLQPGFDSPQETISEMAERFAKILFNKIRVKDNFYLLGYEMGVPVILEIAKILEKHGLKGTIFCIGCTPDDLKDVVDKELKDFETDDQLQNEIVKHTYRVVMKEDCAVIENALNSASIWIEKVDVCVRRTLGSVALSAQYIAALMEAALARIKQIRTYSCSVVQLRSKVILLRALSAFPSSELKMQKYSQEPVAVHDLGTSLRYVTQDMRCSAIINQYLSADILDAFDRKNLCEVYITDSTTRFAVL